MIGKENLDDHDNAVTDKVLNIFFRKNGGNISKRRRQRIRQFLHVNAISRRRDLSATMFARRNADDKNQNEMAGFKGPHYMQWKEFLHIY